MNRILTENSLHISIQSLQNTIWTFQISKHDESFNLDPAFVKHQDMCYFLGTLIKVQRTNNVGFGMKISTNSLWNTRYLAKVDDAKFTTASNKCNKPQNL